MMYFLVYVSSAVRLFSSSELAAILAQSRENNSKLGISGMLLYKGGNLMQVLEGEEAAVRTLYAKIARDPRHTGLLILLDGALSVRQFPDWSMAFRDLNAPEVLSTPGYSEFLNTPLTQAEFSSDPTRCQRLLTTFKKSM
ncbi:MAG: BLUF domain-containing protein [Acidobacteriota bacterium]